ncbi:porin [Paracidovorax avenae]|uniref:porin n=1 Tax=Paracidovorax avenae TaxID=80867 RepID=UPI000AEE9F0D|nr:porin [Paracidovorax avenae]
MSNRTIENTAGLPRRGIIHGLPSRLLAGTLAAWACSQAPVWAQTAQKEELRRITTPAGGLPAAASSVTLYGLIDTSIAYASAPGGRIAKLDSGHMNGSRLGFRGSEDLGGGLRANFWLEAGINVDTGTSGQNQGAGPKFFGRGSLIGLTGGFGEVRLGRTVSTISSEVQAVGDAFGLGGGGNLQSLQPSTGRANNTLWYQTPAISGFIGKASYSFGERAGSEAANQPAVGLFYTTDTLSGAVSYTTLRNPTDLTTLRWLNSSLAYQFGSFKLFGSFATFKNPGAAVTPAVHAALDGNVLFSGFPTVGYYAGQNDRSVSLGVSVPFGASTVLAQVVKLDDRGPLNRDATQFGVAYLYALSKRTTLYADYGKVKNRNGAAYAVSGATTQAGLSDSGNSDAVHLGVRHTF